MKDLLTLCVVLFEVLVLVLSQRIAPGVPPQQYQQLPPQQQQQPYQQQPYYQQQPQVQHNPNVAPIHQQQPQQFQQPAPVQTPPPGQAPHHPHANHGQPGHHGQLLNAANLALEKEHIQEHLDVPVDTSKMTEQELQFHYFKMHDADNNNKLDGCELIKSLIHWHAEAEENDKQELKIQRDEDLEAMIDPILKEMDSNNDGYVDYAEFKKAS